ncbi:MAG: radical SAM/Cys-rich domain protein [Zetaproteobacteria bacterium]|nr:MAG: radical SAM/Cys-rich domain protein [Zetaproteobacteria bacterium]
MHAMSSKLKCSDFPSLARKSVDTLQVNLGYRCNQSCMHCHVGAGPRRKEMMDADTVQAVLDFLRASSVGKLDLTGGAPEMNPHFRELVAEAVSLGVRVMDRCNLTILEEPAYEGMAEFLADHGVEVIASLPCYLEENVDAQRGKGIFQASIRALRRLNALGYGREGTGLVLNLVYNPQGPHLPPPQASLEAAYKRELAKRFGIAFNQLFTITNMPIQRFGSMLVSKGLFAEYMQLLKDAYRPENLDGVMCRTLISVDWQGYVFDCDFNQMLGLPLVHRGRSPVHLSELMGEDLAGNPIIVLGHCYGCTAGQGSSCGGALDGAVA